MGQLGFGHRRRRLRRLLLLSHHPHPLSRVVNGGGVPRRGREGISCFVKTFLIISQPTRTFGANNPLLELETVASTGLVFRDCYNASSSDEAQECPLKVLMFKEPLTSSPGLVLTRGGGPPYMQSLRRLCETFFQNDFKLGLI
jgi:hypothetical protein